ncbi:hypothetical protein ACFYRN_25200 [Streptomyces sp. NPDC005227]|uniref:hypothetical protein n=1 Tax=Streptomyces sp. NPDC005227 TaxID=3364707 RepID=UPI0036CB3E15
MSARDERLSGAAARHLGDRLRAITGRAVAEVRITRVRWPEGLRWVAMILAADPRAPRGRREVPITEAGQHRKLALLLRDTFPHADWAHAQDYDVGAGTLREHLVRLPDCLAGDAL